MGNNNSRRIEILEKKNKKLHEHIENNGKNIVRLVEIVQKIPGPSLELDHLKIKKTLLIQDPTSKNYIHVSYDSEKNEFRVDKNVNIKDDQKCFIM